MEPEVTNISSKEDPEVLFALRIYTSAHRERLEEYVTYWWLPFDEIAFNEVAYAAPAGENNQVRDDYMFHVVNEHGDRSQPPFAQVQTHFFQVGQKHRLDLNNLHSFLAFYQVRAIMQTFFVELDNPSIARPLVHPTREDVHICFNGFIRDVAPAHRRVVFGETTASSASRVSQAWAFCVMKLFVVHQDSDGHWNFGRGDPQATFNVLLDIICLYFKAFETAKYLGIAGQIPEDWFYWIQTHDPWVRKIESVSYHPSFEYEEMPENDERVDDSEVSDFQLPSRTNDEPVDDSETSEYQPSTRANGESADDSKLSGY